MRSWEYFFRPHILERGEEYYYEGNVTDIEFTLHGYRAVVRGTHDYIVEAEIQDDRITDLTCTCPYAGDGSHCKHEAALLYAVFNEEETGNPADFPESEETVDDILNRMSEDQLRNELKEIVRKDQSVSNRIYAKYRFSKPDQNNVQKIYRALDALAYEYGDRYGFIDWRSGSDYVSAFCECMQDMIVPLIDDHEYDTALAALDKAFYVLNTVEMDGSYGEHGQIAYDIETLWDRIIHEVSDEERKRLHDRFEQMLDQDSYMICADSIENVLENSFDDPEYLMPRIEQIRQELNEDYLDRQLKGLLKTYRSLLQRCGMDLKEYEDWLDSHRDSEAVKEILLDDAREKGDIPAQIRILEELTADPYHASFFDQDRLAQLYEESGENEKLKQLLIAILLKSERDDPEKLEQLRSLCTEKQYIPVREEWLEKHPKRKPLVYSREGLYDRLIKCLKEEKIETVDNYLHILKDKFPKKLAEIYVKALDRMTYEHPCAPLYERMEKYMSRALTIQGIKEPLKKTMDAWKQDYPTRKSLMTLIADTERQLAKRKK